MEITIRPQTQRHDDGVNMGMTTGQALARLNEALATATADRKRQLKRGRRYLVNKWIRAGLQIQYAPHRSTNPVHEGVPVAPERLLTDQPGLIASIACGAVAGYMLADERHPADQWLVQVAGVRYLTADAAEARELFHWAMERKRQAMIREEVGADYDAD